MKPLPWIASLSRVAALTLTASIATGCGLAFPPPPTRATSLPSPSNMLTSVSVVPIDLRLSQFAQALNRRSSGGVLDSGWRSIQSASPDGYADVRTLIAHRLHAALAARGFVPRQFRLTLQRGPIQSASGSGSSIELAFNDRYRLELRNSAGEFVCSRRTQRGVEASAAVAARINAEGNVTAHLTDASQRLPALCLRAGEALNQGLSVDLGSGLQDRYARALYGVSGGVANVLQHAADFAFRAPFAVLSRLLARPIAVSDNLWLTPNVQNLAIRNLAFGAQGNDLLVRFSIAVAARPQISIGAQPPALQSAVPRISALEVPEGFHLPIDVRVPFDLLVQHARQQLIGTELPVAVIGTVRVNDVDIYATDAGTADAPKGQLVIEIAFSGGASGKLYLQGTPYIDPATRIVSIPDLNYTVQTRHLLVRAFAPLLTANFVVAKVRGAATYDASKAIDQAVAPFMRPFQTTLRPDNNVAVTVSATPTQPQLLGASVDAQALYVHAAINGGVSAHVDVRADALRLPIAPPG